jgi:hypothetical protein
VAAKPFDPTLKALVETEPESWPILRGRPAGPTEVIDADIASLTGAADKVLHVSTPEAYFLQIEFVAGDAKGAGPRTSFGATHQLRSESRTLFSR